MCAQLWTGMCGRDLVDTSLLLESETTNPNPATVET